MSEFVLLTSYWAETPVLIPVDDIRLVSTRRRRSLKEIDSDVRTYREMLDRLARSAPSTDPLHTEAIPLHEAQVARLLREREEDGGGSVVLLDAGRGSTREQAVLEDVATIADRIEEVSS